MTEVLDQISDELIENEYRKQFFLKAGDPVHSSEEAAKHFTAMFSSDPSRECFAVMYLNGRNALISVDVLFKGTLTASAVYPREIIKKALENHAAAIICSHNHPSGNLNPSGDDMTITKRIKAACETVDIAFHDHLIVTSEGFYSFADHGLL
ncbi:MAG: JAB domain-containing protein [Nitrososphaerales archaeon]